jgi:hypothetical protein
MVERPIGVFLRNLRLDQRFLGSNISGRVSSEKNRETVQLEVTAR